MRDRLGRYFRPLTDADRQMLRARLTSHRDRLEAAGYELTIAEGNGGLFAAVLVIDDDRGRIGFLEEDGRVTWLGDGITALGKLGSAVAQNQTEELTRHAETVRDLDGVDVQ